MFVGVLRRCPDRLVATILRAGLWVFVSRGAHRSPHRPCRRGQVQVWRVTHCPGSYLSREWVGTDGMPSHARPNPNQGGSVTEESDSRDLEIFRIASHGFRMAAWLHGCMVLSHVIRRDATRSLLGKSLGVLG